MVAKRKAPAPAAAEQGEAFSTDTATGVQPAPKGLVKGWGAKVAQPPATGDIGSTMPGAALTDEERAAAIAEQDERLAREKAEQEWQAAAPHPNSEGAPFENAADADLDKAPAATSDGEPRPNLKKEPPQVSSDTVAQQQLTAFVERIERLDEERKGIADDMREVFAEAKGNGFDVPTLRAVLRRRKMDTNALLESDALLDLYEHAIGAAHTKDDSDVNADD